MANRSAAHLGMTEALEDKGKFFWKSVQTQLDDGSSISEIAKTLDVKFDDLWSRLRQDSQMSGYLPKLSSYLEREKDADANKRLLKYWDKIVASYTKKFKRRNKLTGGESPETLGVRWGVKPSLVKRRLKDAGILLEANSGVHQILCGTSVKKVINLLLE